MTRSSWNHESRSLSGETGSSNWEVCQCEFFGNKSPHSCTGHQLAAKRVGGETGTEGMSSRLCNFSTTRLFLPLNSEVSVHGGVPGEESWMTQHPGKKRTRRETKKQKEASQRTQGPSCVSVCVPCSGPMCAYLMMRWCKHTHGNAHGW